MTNRVGEQFGNYRLTRLLGTGGFAEVYLAEHIHLGTRVAIKVLIGNAVDQKSQEMFEHEAKTLADLSHPHIVQLLDFGTEPMPYLIMEFIEQGSIRSLYTHGTIVPISEVVLYVGQIASALQHAHDKRLIHRDIKPDNLLVRHKSHIVLSDFGIVTAAHSSSSLKTGETAGTVAYMSPEQMQGKPTPATDQYALAVVVYEWLCGTLPFVGVTPIELMMQVLAAKPEPLSQRVPSITPEINAVVMRAMAKDPKDRFASVTEFADALQEASWHSTPTAQGSQPLPAGSDSTTFVLLGNLSTVPGNAMITDVLGSSSQQQTISAPLTSAKLPVGQTNGLQSSAKGSPYGWPRLLTRFWQHVLAFVFRIVRDALAALAIGLVSVSAIMAYITPTETAASKGVTAGFLIGVATAVVVYSLTYGFATIEPELASRRIATRFWSVVSAVFIGQICGVAVGVSINSGILEGLLSAAGLLILYGVAAALAASRRS